MAKGCRQVKMSRRKMKQGGPVKSCGAVHGQVTCKANEEAASG
jgi:hypothetical protein